MVRSTALAPEPIADPRWPAVALVLISMAGCSAGSSSTGSARPPAVDTQRGWVGPEQSSFREITHPTAECWKDIGCPYEPSAIPPCPPNLYPLTVAEANALADGQEGPDLDAPKLVEGVLLADWVIPLLPCDEGRCCQVGDGGLVLVDRLHENDPEAMLAKGISLTSSLVREAFRCTGDASAACCGFPQVRVIAAGRLRDDAMLEPRLCRP